MELSDELKAVEVTLSKWEELLNQINSLNSVTSNACGFCEVYFCASDTCPAYKRCDKISVIYDAHYIIMKETKKNIRWLKRRRTMLTKKIKACAQEEESA